MTGNSVAVQHKRKRSITHMTCIVFVLLPLASIGYIVYAFDGCIDGCGPYHNSTSVADLDGDGDLDVVVSNLRHESETIIWAGPTFWINQAGGNFAPRRVAMGGPSTVAGDLDGDGDPDIVQLEYNAALWINRGGEKGWKIGSFRRSRALTPSNYLHNWTTPGWVVLGDLNNDSRLDVLVSYCCSMLIDREKFSSKLQPFLPYVWINSTSGNGDLAGHGVNLDSIGDLPMRPTLGDLDGDGDLDIYAALLPPKGEKYDTADRILLNDASGNFTDSGQRLENPSATGAAASAGVALGDLDGDGDLDALVGKAAGAMLWTNLGGAQGGQAGVFAASEQRLGRGRIEAAFLADLDADGDLDAVVAGKNQASIWWNDGQARFSDSGQRLRYTERHALALGDFNADGHPDFLAAAYDIGAYLWLNQGDGILVKTK